MRPAILMAEAVSCTLIRHAGYGRQRGKVREPVATSGWASSTPGAPAPPSRPAAFEGHGSDRSAPGRTGALPAQADRAEPAFSRSKDWPLTVASSATGDGLRRAVRVKQVASAILIS
jgi:hypothetical protein